jgi:hypothetical protein
LYCMAITYSSLGFVRSIAFDVLFCLYIFLVEPLILPELKIYVNQAYTYKSPSYWIALVIIAAMACEIPGIYLKFKAIGDKILKAGLGKPGQSITIKWGFVIYLLHTAVGLMVAMSAFRAFGLTLHENENLFALLFIIYLVWEGIITYLVFTARIPEGPRPHAFIKNMLGETCLFIFGTIAFTATWRINPVQITEFSSETILAIFFASILFLMFYLPCNLATVYDNFLTATSRKQVLYRIASLILVVMAALFPFQATGKSSSDQTAYGVVYRAAYIEAYKERFILEMKMQKRTR